MRQTVPRRAILDALHDADEPVSAEDVFLLVHARYPGIGIATVYRTLQLLTELGVSARIDSGDGKARYTLAEPDRPMRHVVLTCRRCGRIEPLPITEPHARAALEGLEQVASASHRFSVEQSMVQLGGVCGDCRDQAARPTSRTQDEEA